MRIIAHADQSQEFWRPEVMTRMIASAANGSAQLCLFEQWCEPGAGAPTHHHAVEELLTTRRRPHDGGCRPSRQLNVKRPSPNS